LSIIKIYRYRVSPEKVNQFLEMQKQADSLYREHITYSIAYVRSVTDPWEWMEIHEYPDREMLSITEKLSEDNRLKSLFQEFLNLLDPKDRNIREEVFEKLS